MQQPGSGSYGIGSLSKKRKLATPAGAAAAAAAARAFLMARDDQVEFGGLGGLDGDDYLQNNQEGEGGGSHRKRARSADPNSPHPARGPADGEEEEEGLGLGSGLRRRASGINSREQSVMDDGTLPRQQLFSAGSHRRSDVNDDSPLTGATSNTASLLTHRAGDVLDKIVASLVTLLPSSTLSPVALSLKAGGGAGDGDDDGEIALTALLSQGGDQVLTQARLDLDSFLDQYASNSMAAAAATTPSAIRGAFEGGPVKLTRIQACRCFAELLALHGRGFIRMEQAGPYRELEIMITTTGVERCSRDRFAAALITQVQSQA